MGFPWSSRPGLSPQHRRSDPAPSSSRHWYFPSTTGRLCPEKAAKGGNKRAWPKVVDSCYTI